MVLIKRSPQALVQNNDDTDIDKVKDLDARFNLMKFFPMAFDFR